MKQLISSYWHRCALVVATCSLMGVAASCGDPAGPGEIWPTPPVPAPLPATITDWTLSEPQFVQRGVFHYNAARQLTRYDFGHVLPDGTHLITYYTLPEYAGQRMVGAATYARDYDRFVHVRQTEFTYDASGRLTTRRISSLNESTGAIQDATTEYQYDSSNRLAAVLQGQERRVFSYDAAGNVVREKLLWAGSPTLVYEYDYGRSFNPLAGLQPQVESMIVLMRFGSGDYNMSAWRVREEGHPPASSATIAYELNAQGFPTRRTIRAVNTDLPNVPATFISVIEYLE